MIEYAIVPTTLMKYHVVSISIIIQHLIRIVSSRSNRERLLRGKKEGTTRKLLFRFDGTDDITFREFFIIYISPTDGDASAVSSQLTLAGV